MANAKTSTTTTLNVLQKLIKARTMFLEKNVKKSGKNMHLEYTYYELADIVPIAIAIFNTLGILTKTSFDGVVATMEVYNADNPEESPIVFTAPYKEVEPIVSNTGKTVTNALQALGSSITYLRRYLYMIVLDIVECDEIDATLGATIEVPETKSNTPATPAERKAAKEELTSENALASEGQIAELKQLCKTLLNKDETMDEFIQQIALKTEGFTKITATACTELNKNLSGMIEAYGGE